MAWCLVKHRDNFTFTFTRRRWEDDINIVLGETSCEIVNWTEIVKERIPLWGILLAVMKLLSALRKLIN
jgi:hypothetical protein